MDAPYAVSSFQRAAPFLGPAGAYNLSLSPLACAPHFPPFEKPADPDGDVGFVAPRGATPQPPTKFENKRKMNVC
ncbi:hypothetical protein PVL29_005119 [Vitis rotundifolia]|uniref:Uncharacterized protein n=1 Tax=Vitis rotundifolia TaxID=103349 RepID=A0AA39A9V5_VITRO|nr:hypothetical protein PVL29_005119 [Vitis rotundifolia]